jgi:mycothiol synthase
VKTELPENYTAHQTGMEHIPEIHRLEQKKALHYLGQPGFSLDYLKNLYQSPGFDLEQSSMLIRDQAGSLVALVEVWDELDPPVHPHIWLTVDPDYEDQGLEDYLLAWAEERAMQVFDRVDPELRIAIRSGINSKIGSGQRAYLRAGLKLIRHGLQMRIEMDKKPPEPIWPEGIQLKPYNPEEDARLVYETDEEAFQDHFGFVKEDLEEGFKRFMHHLTGDDTYDPSLWFLATEGEEIVAICICRRYGLQDPDTGYVSSLGVKRPWRRRGVAQALLLHAFGEYYRRGKRVVDLGVDAESLTGATDLYKKVGMYVLRQHDYYEKELRPGKEISVTKLGGTSE